MNDCEFLIEVNTQDVLKYIVTDTQLSVADAMRRFYASEVFEKLQDSETGLYLESPAYIYSIFKSEMQNHRILQDEI